MMTKNLVYHYLMIVVALSLFSGHLTQAGELVFEPAKPVVAVGESISISVSGSIKNIFWQVSKGSGKIQGAVNSARVTYVAPNKVGLYWLIVFGEDAAAKNMKYSSLLGITVLSKSDCEKHPTCAHKDAHKPKAAIMIHAAGETSGGEIQEKTLIFYPFLPIKPLKSKKNQEKTLNYLAHYAYQGLKNTLFKDDDIYYLAPNGNRQQFIEPVISSTESENSTSSAELTVDHIEGAFNWAKRQEIGEQPLIVIFIGSGLPDKLILGSSNHLPSEQLNALLDDYQTVTGNQVVVILEASYSGTLIKHLKGKGRIIISSTDEQLAYYSHFGQNSFTRFYFDQLQKGKNYWEALQLSQALFSALPPPFKQQQPQLEDSADKALAQKLCLNQCWVDLPGPVLKILTLEEILAPHQTVNLSVEADDVRSVEVTIAKSGSRQPPIILKLREEPIGSGQWHTSYNGFITHGDYIINFNAQSDDNRPQRCVIQNTNKEYCFITLEVEQEDGMTHASLNGNILSLPALAVPDEKGGEVFFQAKFIQHPNLGFELDFNSLVFLNDITSLSVARYNPDTFTIEIPLLDTPDGVGQQATLRWVPAPGPVLFELKIE